MHDGSHRHQAGLDWRTKAESPELDERILRLPKQFPIVGAIAHPRPVAAGHGSSVPDAKEGGHIGPIGRPSGSEGKLNWVALSKHRRTPLCTIPDRPKRRSIKRESTRRSAGECFSYHHRSATSLHGIIREGIHEKEKGGERKVVKNSEYNSYSGVGAGEIGPKNPQGQENCGSNPVRAWLEPFGVIAITPAQTRILSLASNFP